MSAVFTAILAIALGAAPPIQTVYDAEFRSVVVPRVEARGVDLDGTFSPGEWDGAVRYRISKDVDLYLAADDEALRIGLKCTKPDSSVDLFLTSNRREFVNLHASMALAETWLTFPCENGLGPLEMGRHVDWDANRLDKTPSVRVDGFEFRILRKKVGADCLRLALRMWCEERVAYPAAANLRSADDWVELILPPPQVRAAKNGPLH